MAGLPGIALWLCCAVVFTSGSVEVGGDGHYGHNATTEQLLKTAEEQQEHTEWRWGVHARGVLRELTPPGGAYRRFAIIALVRSLWAKLDVSVVAPRLVRKEHAFVADVMKYPLVFFRFVAMHVLPILVYGSIAFAPGRLARFMDWVMQLGLGANVVVHACALVAGLHDKYVRRVLLDPKMSPLIARPLYLCPIELITLTFRPNWFEGVKDWSGQHPWFVLFLFVAWSSNKQPLSDALLWLLFSVYYGFQGMSKDWEDLWAHIRISARFSEEAV